jgi:hypothetical protein
MIVRVLLRAMLHSCALYVVLVAVLMLLETRLVYPARDPALNDWIAADLPREEMTCISADGTVVHGWLLEGPAGGPAIVLFHGNAEDVAEVAPRTGQRLRERLGATVLVFDFRGYGKTQGIPTEKRILEDGVAAVNWMAQRLGTTPDQLVFYGRSLGGGVALGTAAKTGAGMLILDRTFSSLAGAGQANYPWVPATWLMRNQYPSAQWISNLDIPLFQSHFTGDRVVPFALGRRLFEASPAGQKEFLRLEGGHHLAALPEAWWDAAIPFVAQHAPRVTGQ